MPRNCVKKKTFVNYHFDYKESIRLYVSYYNVLGVFYLQNVEEKISYFDIKVLRKFIIYNCYDMFKSAEYSQELWGKNSKFYSFFGTKYSIKIIVYKF